MIADERRVDPNDCIMWDRAMKSNLYGVCWDPSTKKVKHVHRLVLEEVLDGPIPDGMEVDHLCSNRLCINPDHLEVVPKIVNIRRGACTKLTEGDVRAILRDPRMQTAIAEEYGISHGYVSRIKAGHHWQDVE